MARIYFVSAVRTEADPVNIEDTLTTGIAFTRCITFFLQMQRDCMENGGYIFHINNFNLLHLDITRKRGSIKMAEALVFRE